MKTALQMELIIKDRRLSGMGGRGWTMVDSEISRALHWEANTTKPRPERWRKNGFDTAKQDLKKNGMFFVEAQERCVDRIDCRCVAQCVSSTRDKPRTKALEWTSLQTSLAILSRIEAHFVRERCEV